MPKGTKVHRCVDKVKKSKDIGAAIAICQDSTKQGYATGKKLKEAIAAKVIKPGAGKQAKKLGDEHDDKWEAEETKKGYWTPAADDTTGYSSKTSDNASDDFQHGGWKNETKAKKGKKIMKTKNEETDEAAADKAAKEESKKKPKKPEAPDAVEKAMGKAKKGHPGGIQHFRDKIMKAGKDAVKKHDEELAGESRSYAFKKLASVLAEKEWTTGFQDPEHKPKPVKPIAHGSKAIEAARKDLPQNVKDEAKKKVAAEEAARLKKQQNSHTEYKRMGLYLAEAMGYRIDEFLPAVAAMAGRAVVGSVVKKVAGKALASDEDKKKKELAAQNKSAEVQEEGKAAVIKAALTKVAKNPKVRAAVLRAGSQVATSMADKEEKKTQSDDDLKEGKIMNSYVKKLMEWEAGPTAKRIARTAGDEEGRVSDTGGKIKDPLVKKEVATTQANVDKKLGVKTNLRTKDAIQGSMNRRRAAVKAGKSVEGSAPLPRETRKDAAADAAQDKKRREAPGDQ
jgi:hypothetical protein